MVLFAAVLILLVMIFGSLGNIISLIVWTKGKRSCNIACTGYFKCLSVTDLLFLLVNGTEYFIRLAFTYYLQDLHVVICRLVFFVDEFLPQVSAWLVVALSVERVVNVCFPLACITPRYNKRSYVVFAILVLVSTCLNSMSFVAPILIPYPADYNYDYDDATNATMLTYCGFDKDLQDTFFLMSTISYAGGTFLVPLVMIIGSNVLIIWKLLCTSRNTSTSEIQKKRAISMAKVVSFIGTLHCVSTLPRAFNWLVVEVDAGLFPDAISVIEQIANVCFFLNSGLNCVVYCIFGRDFRADLVELSGFYRLRKRSKTSTTTCETSAKSGSTVECSPKT